MEFCSLELGGLERLKGGKNEGKYDGIQNCGDDIDRSWWSRAAGIGVAGHDLGADAAEQRELERVIRGYTW